MRPATAPRSSATIFTDIALSRVFAVALSYTHDFLRGLAGAHGGGLHAACDLLRGGALLGDGRGNGARNLADIAYRALDCPDRLDRARGRLLHPGDLGRGGRPARA